MNSKLTWIAAISAVILTSYGKLSVAAKRHHHAHEHGKGELNLALEGKVLEIELKMPAIHVIGFEHAPKNDAQAKKVASAIESLRKNTELFQLNAAANCKIEKAKVEAEGLDYKKGKHAKHKHHHHGHGHKEKKESAHSEFEMSYRYQCQNPEKLKNIGVNAFNVFNNVDELKAVSISSQGSKKHKLTKKNNQIKIN